METEDSHGDHGGGSVSGRRIVSAGTRQCGRAAASGEAVELLCAGQTGLVLRAVGEGVVLWPSHVGKLRLSVNFVDVRERVVGRVMISHVEPCDTQQLWSEFGDRLRAFITRRVGSAADAEDILQEVFLRIHRHAGALQHRERLIPWLFQITRNAIADYYRAPVRRELLGGAPQDLEQDAEHTLRWVTVCEEAPADAARELASCLRPMVARLPAPYREAVTLIDLEGMPQKDAALQAGLSLSGMKSRVQRGRQALEQLVHDCCQIEVDATGHVMDYQLRGTTCGSSCAGGCAAS
jgi:RNA polymerase sigma-70 factor (ECF subfamily)